MNEHYFSVDSIWKPELKAEVYSASLNHKLEIVLPPHQPGGIEGEWTPGHLIVASVNSCFMLTFMLLAKKHELNIKACSSSCKGKTQKVNENYMVSDLEIEIEIIISVESDRNKTEKLLKKTESACIICNSIKSRLSVNYKLRTVV